MHKQTYWIISFLVNLIKMLKVRSFVAHTSTLHVYKEMNEATLYKPIGDFFVGMT